MEAVARRTPKGTYNRYEPIIKMLYVHGVPSRDIAELLGLNRETLQQRIYDWDLTTFRSVYHDRLLDLAREMRDKLDKKVCPECDGWG